ncbi:MAG: hypothetical protein ABIY50_12855, partial [Ignavibacteria bacterium]
QSLVTQTFAATAANTYLTYDRAYSPFFSNTDSLIIETSVNGGSTYSTLVSLWGNENTGAPLNTVGRINDFSPTSGGQWRPTIFALPVGTNRIKFRARSGFGNNLYLDNICLQVLPTAVTNTIGIASQGMWIPVAPYWRLADTVRVYLHRTDFPNVVVDSSISFPNSNAIVSPLFNKALNGSYYKVIRHRNSIETWSNTGLAYIRGSNTHFNFITPDGQAFANNQAIVSTSPFYRGMYSGDVGRSGSYGVQDSVVDGSDLSFIDNDAVNFVTGYVITDLTGDNATDGADLAVCENSAAEFAIRIAPAGGEPDVTPEQPKSLTEADRMKIEEGNRIQRERDLKNPPVDSKKFSYEEYLRSRHGNLLKNNPNVRLKENVIEKIQKNNSNTDNRVNGKLAGEL